MFIKYSPILAQAYGEGSYGASTYQNGTTTATGTGTTSSGGLLTNTGFDALLVITVACAIIFVALVVRLWRKPRRNSQSN